MNDEEIEHQLYLLSNEIADYNRKIKDCEIEIKDNLDMKKDALVAVKELFKQLKYLEEYDPVVTTLIDEKYSYLLNF